MIGFACILKAELTGLLSWEEGAKLRRTPRFGPELSL